MSLIRQRLLPCLMLCVLAVCAPLAARAERRGEGESPALRQYMVAGVLGRGVNILGYDPIWTDPSRARFKQSYFRRLSEGGFRTVRLNLQAFDHMAPDGTLDPQWLKTLDGVLDQAGQAGLSVIVDEHDFDTCGEHPEPCRPKLMAFWRQISARYASAPSTVYFEILNEPSRKLTAPLWNSWIVEALAIIRRSDPDRQVIVGPVGWNNFRRLPDLQLPAADHNLIVTLHYYEPMNFTHQGAGWVKETKDLHDQTWGSAADRAKVASDFDVVAAWAKANGRPIFLGEFGALENGAMPMRADWTATVARTAEAHGWPWAYWQFDGNFILFDEPRDGWVKPIHDALVPPGIDR